MTTSGGASVPSPRGGPTNLFQKPTRDTRSLQSIEGLLLCALYSLVYNATVVPVELVKVIAVLPSSNSLPLEGCWRSRSWPRGRFAPRSSTQDSSRIVNSVFMAFEERHQKRSARGLQKNWRKKCRFGLLCWNVVDDVGFLDSGRVFPSFKHRWIAGEIKLNIDGSSADWVCVVNLFTETTPDYGGEKCFVFFFFGILRR